MAEHLHLNIVSVFHSLRVEHKSRPICASWHVPSARVPIARGEQA